MSRGCEFEKPTFHVPISDHGKVMPGTCMACVFGEGEHTEECESAQQTCEQQVDGSFRECRKPAVAVCLDYGMAMCADHANNCRERGHRVEVIG